MAAAGMNANDGCRPTSVSPHTRLDHPKHAYHMYVKGSRLYKYEWRRAHKAAVKRNDTGPMVVFYNWLADHRE
jgi:hypothetical protein